LLTSLFISGLQPAEILEGKKRKRLEIAGRFLAFLYISGSVSHLIFGSKLNHLGFQSDPLFGIDVAYG
jgi:hypothetical protein